MIAAIEGLCEDHANMAKLLDVFERQLALFERLERPDYDILDGVIQYYLVYPDLYHHPKEDLLIAKLSERDSARRIAVQALRQEHIELGSLTRWLAAAIRHVRLDAELPRESFSMLGRDFLSLNRRHMQAEERILFAAARAVLTPEDWAEIDRELAVVADPLFGSRHDQRFEVLRNSIFAWDGCR